MSVDRHPGSRIEARVSRRSALDHGSSFYSTDWLQRVFEHSTDHLCSGGIIVAAGGSGSETNDSEVAILEDSGFDRLERRTKSYRCVHRERVVEFLVRGMPLKEVHEFNRCSGIKGSRDPSSCSANRSLDRETQPRIVAQDSMSFCEDTGTLAKRGQIDF